MKKTIATIVWAWKIKEGLCHWAEPMPGTLLDKHKPSPEAIKVKCALMSYSDYLKLRGKK